MDERKLRVLFQRYGSQAKVAEHLGISDTHVRRLREKFGLELWTVVRPITQEKEKSRDADETSG